MKTGSTGRRAGKIAIFRGEEAGFRLGLAGRNCYCSPGKPLGSSPTMHASLISVMAADRLSAGWNRPAAGWAILLAAGWLWGGLPGIVALAADADLLRPCVMRVESEVFTDDDEEPVARSLTLFRDGIAWDFLDKPAGSADAPAGKPEIVLHDPARERVVLIDPGRNIKTQIETIRLERLSVSLSAWARKSDDRLVQWAGGPDFGAGMEEDEDQNISLQGPRVRYAVEYTKAPSAEAANAYRRFADTALLVKALLHPGGLPPFPRLAINRRVSAAEGIPTQVTLELASPAAAFGGRPRLMRSVHKLHPRLLTEDLKRIEDAEARVAMAAAVDLAAFADPAEVVQASATEAAK